MRLVRTHERRLPQARTSAPLAGRGQGQRDSREVMWLTADAPKPGEPLRAAQIVKLGVLTMTSEREGEIHTIALTGELDLASAPDVEAELKRVEATDANAIVLDLSGLTFIDSTGIRLVVTADARSRADANRLSLLRGPASVQRVFAIAGVEQLVPFAD